MDRKQARLRRAAKTRFNIKNIKQVRLCVFRTPKHIYAQIISADAATVLVAVSTVEKAVAADLKATGNIAAAEKIGQLIAERAKKAGVTEVAFDRSGFKYHGRVKALAEAARKHGLKF